MNRAEEFLDKYKQLEQAATAAYGWEPDGKAIYRLERMQQFESVRTELNYCREVRNLLQHNCRIDGAYAVEPSSQMLELMDRVLRQVVNPKRCLDICTPMDQIFARSLSDRVGPTMLTMYRRGLSHVPILTDGRVVGVFSESTIFSYLIGRQPQSWEENLRFSDLREFLNTTTRRSEVYRFLPLNATVAQAEAEFEQAFQTGKRISMFLLTKNGSREERLLGVLTAYDILGA